MPVTAGDAATRGHAAVVAALSAVARAIAGTFELDAVLERVAAAALPVLPFDELGVVCSSPPGVTFVHAPTLERPRMSDRVAIDDVSPRLRPHPELRTERLADVTAELDPVYRVDRRILERGGSLLRTPLRRGDDVVGVLWFAAGQTGVFQAGHEPVAEAIAELVALALEQERRSRLERERRQRSDALEALLPTLAGALDLRAVFHQVSTVAQAVLPHVFLGVGLLNDEKTALKVYAISEPVSGELPVIVLPGPIREENEADYLVFSDIVLDPATGVARSHLHRAGTAETTVIHMELEPFRRRLIQDNGIRCLLRVPVRLGGAVAGFMIVASREPEQYGADDAALARRIADHVALALSHQRLAEEERRRVEAAERADQLAARVARLREELEAHGPHRALGRSRKWRDVLAQATKVAATETTVLLTGESGTGKEVVARFIHRASPRAEGPFVALNCAALPDQLLESELFGYERGAFTGATAPKPGRLEQAAGGLLFLDEVGETSALVQAKLLRVLQEREFQRLGGTRVQKADVRVVAATNRDLKGALARGEFREDLFYRLHVFEIALPPLRERPEDILTLVEAFLAEIGAAIARPPAGLSREAREQILAYSWPGNVRELRNAIERAVILCEGGLVTSEHLPIALETPAVRRVGPAALPPGGLSLEGVERELVEKALAQARNNKSKAARLLGLTRAQLYSRLEKYGLARE